MTSNVRRLYRVMALATSEHRSHPTMAAITAPPGEGKTCAIDKYVSSRQTNSYSGLPSVIAFGVDPNSKRRHLARQVVKALADKPGGGNTYEILYNAAEAIQRNNLKLLILDEADQLTPETFEVLRYLHDRTGCAIALVGIPSIMAVIEGQEKFSSRVSIRMAFKAIEMDEMLGTVLPNLSFSHWQFDASAQADRALGEYLWETVRPSLRRLVHWIQHADILAELEDRKRITRDVLEDALDATTTKGTVSDKSSTEQTSAPGTPEHESELRNAHKFD